MDYALIMGCFQCTKDLHDQSNSLFGFTLPSLTLQVLFQVFSFNVLKGDKADAINLTRIVDLTDLWMVNFRR